MTVLAHSSHWITSVLYALPAVVLIGWLGFTKFKDNRARRRDG